MFCMLSELFAAFSVRLSSAWTARVVSSCANRLGGAFIGTRASGLAGLFGGKGGGMVDVQPTNPSARIEQKKRIELVRVVIVFMFRWRSRWACAWTCRGACAARRF